MPFKSAAGLEHPYVVSSSSVHAAPLILVLAAGNGWFTGWLMSFFPLVFFLHLAGLTGFLFASMAP